MRPSYLVGTLIGREPHPGKNLFVMYNRQQYKVAPELCRPAFGLENWTPSPADVDALSHAERAARNETVDQGDPDVVPDEGEPVEPHIVLDPTSGSLLRISVRTYIPSTITSSLPHRLCLSCRAPAKDG